jgi:hypothetical protein
LFILIWHHSLTFFLSLFLFSFLLIRIKWDVYIPPKKVEEEPAEENQMIEEQGSGGFNYSHLPPGLVPREMRETAAEPEEKEKEGEAMEVGEGEQDKEAKEGGEEGENNEDDEDDDDSEGESDDDEEDQENNHHHHQSSSAAHNYQLTTTNNTTSSSSNGNNDLEAVPNPHGRCDLLWQGQIPRRVFTGFKFQECKTGFMARKLLEGKNIAHYWDMLEHADNMMGAASQNDDLLDLLG